MPGDYHNAGTWRHRKKDGTLIEVETSGHGITFAGRRAEQVVINDVTERKRLEEQFRQAQKMEAVGRLAAGVAHDFNNLLTAILGTTDLMLEDLPPDDPDREGLLDIRSASERAAVLTRQLLTFSRQQVVSPQALRLNDLILELEKLLRRLLGEDVAIRVAGAPDCGGVKADPGELEQVIVNLAVNARDAMPNGGRLTLETKNVDLDADYPTDRVTIPAGRYVMLAVTDTGTGMDAQTKARIFEPFFTTKPVGKGTGLGLATVYGAVKQSGGFIWLYSEVGQGTSFKIYLPRVDAPAPQAAVEEPAALLDGSETVLVAEDEDAVRQIIEKALQVHGYRVMVARDGSEALALAARHAGQIDLLDASARVAECLLAGRDDLAEARLAFLAPPGFPYVVIQWGVWRAGGVAVPLAVSHPPAELEYVIRDAEAETVVVHPDFAAAMQAVHLPPTVRTVTTDQAVGTAPRSPLPGVAAGRRAMIVYTSGTTGKPKGVVTTHANIVAQVTSLVTAWEWRADDWILLVLPLHHVHGIINVLTCALWGGARCEMLAKFDAEQVWGRIAAGELTLFMAVPTIYGKLITAWEAAAPGRRAARRPGCGSWCRAPPRCRCSGWSGGARSAATSCSSATA